MYKMIFRKENRVKCKLLLQNLKHFKQAVVNISLFIILLFSLNANAAPNNINFQAKIKKPDGSNLEAPDVSFRFKYINAAGNCTLYMEDFNNLSMAGSAGNVSMSMGSGAKVFPPTATDLAQTFSNTATNTMTCFEGGNYTPVSTAENRKLRVEFIYSGSGGLQALNGIEINSTPYAMYASDTDKLAGLAASLYAKFSDFTTCTGGDVLTYNGTAFSCITPGAATFSGNLVGDVSGTQSATVVDAVGGKTSAQVSTSVDDTLNATNAATASRIVKRDGSGNASFNTAQANNFSGRNILLFEPTDTNKITIRAPATFAAGDYTITLPDSDGSPGYVLSTDGNGVTSWIPAASGSVTTVTATPPLLSSGGATPDISMPAATAAVDGYLSAANFTTFNNKVSSQWTNNVADIHFNTGRVGIGTATPSDLLDVNMVTNQTGITISGPTTFGPGSQPTLSFKRYNAGVESTRSLIFSGLSSGTSGGDLNFATATSTTPITRMRIDASGNVGVGTTDPIGKLTSYNSTTSPATESNAGVYQTVVTGGAVAGIRGSYNGSFIADNSGTNNYGTVIGSTGELYAGYISNPDGTGTTRAWNGLINSATGTSGYIANATSGTGVIVQASGLFSAITNGGSGAIRDAAGVRVAGVRATGTDAGQPHNAYGIYIDNIIASGGSTNNAYSIYSNTTAPSYFNGNVGLGNTAPAYKLDVTGDVNVTGNFKINGVDISNTPSPWLMNVSDTYFNTGRVGIGTNTPGTDLDVRGRVNFETTLAQVFNVVGKGSGYADSTNGIATFYSENNVGSGGNVIKVGSAYQPNGFVVKDNGSIGAGIATPLFPMHFVADNGPGVMMIQNNRGNAATSGVLNIYKHNTAGVGANGIGSSVGFLTDNDAGAMVGTAAIQGILSDVTAGAEKGVLSFQTFSAGAASEAMRITHDGKIGIGTNTPTHLLQLKNQFPYIAFEDTDDVNGGIATVTGNQDGGLYLDANFNNSLTPGKMHFRADGGSKFLLTLLNNGNAGFGGITSPAYKVDVAGDVNVTGNFKINGVNIASGTVDGSGSIGAIPKFSAASTLANSNIADDGTQVTINSNTAIGGAFTPFSKLSIGGGLGNTTRPWMTNGITLGSAGGSDGGYIGLKNEGVNRDDTVIAWGDDMADSLRFINTKDGGSVNGDEYMRIDANGRVGIGTATPGTTLDVAGTGRFSGGIDLSIPGLDNTIISDDPYGFGQNQWIKYSARGGHFFVVDNDSSGNNVDNFEIFKGSSSPANSLLRVQTDGLVGISTALPSAQLTNVSSSDAWTNMGDSGGSGVTPSTAFVWNSQSGGYAQTLSNTSAAVNGNGLQVRIAGNAATQRILTLGTGVAGNATNTDDVMVVRGDGRVGIGTNAPVYGKLSIMGQDDTPLDSALWGTSAGSGLNTTIYNTSQAVNSVAGIKMVTRDINAKVWGMYNVSTGMGTGDLVFGGGQSNTGAEVMRLTDLGNLGLGTSNPKLKMEVATDQTGYNQGIPAVSGTVQNGGIMRLTASVSSYNEVLDVGMNINGPGPSGSTAWFQATNNSTLAQNYNIALNPNGGNVGVNTLQPTAVLDVNGHIANTGSAATLGACGTGSTINGNDARGRVTMGTGSIYTCTINFQTAYATAPFCTFAWVGATAVSKAYSLAATTTTLTLTMATTGDGFEFNYMCLQ